MAPKYLAPSPYSPSSSDPRFPPTSSFLPRKTGLRSASHCPVARISPCSSVSPESVPLCRSLEDPSNPLRLPSPPSLSSAIVSPILPSSPHAHGLSSMDVVVPVPLPSGPHSP
ncbi:hypothetical protein Nepgr_027186 [Nepenthes gracilis]|uniref:Uncharacterized protein n=1 Tax=Nepenthes gracilis TaxID=150966 RepID=A0AAD3T9X4_NEPGR|nr:hypothetical protein Nepgr_027186 [Nepenthes gracilis]